MPAYYARSKKSRTTKSQAKSDAKLSDAQVVQSYIDKVLVKFLMPSSKLGILVFDCRVKGDLSDGFYNVKLRK